jgi:hypothetical protein
VTALILLGLSETTRFRSTPTDGPDLDRAIAVGEAAVAATAADHI